jgi:hypothetical protein
MTNKTDNSKNEFTNFPEVRRIDPSKETYVNQRSKERDSKEGTVKEAIMLSVFVILLVILFNTSVYGLSYLIMGTGREAFDITKVTIWISLFVSVGVLKAIFSGIRS